jgi:DNA-3-methyladenine glycosylase
MKLPHSFYQRSDVVQIAKELLGKYLFTNFNGMLTGGIIVETEAYEGAIDKASHAYGSRRTNRTEIMYAEGGISYVYLCYGIHHLFNVVTHGKDTPHAILIRAIEPVIGTDIMLLRRHKDKLNHTLTSGPGSMSEALGIKTKHNAIDLSEDRIWIEDKGVQLAKNQIVAGSRIGVGYAQEHAHLPYRFWIKDNPWVGRTKSIY